MAPDVPVSDSASASAPQTSLLLVGAGHAHLYLLKHAERLAAAGYALTLLAPGEFRYSGVASATAVGAVDPELGRIDVARLAREHGVRHIDGRLVDCDLATHRVVTDAGVSLTWDVLSLNIGSVSNTSGIEEVEPEVLRVKPLADLGSLGSRLARAQKLAGAQGRRARVTVVGGGSSGMELAGHLCAGGSCDVRVVEAGPSLAATLPRTAQDYLHTLLTRRGASVHTGASVLRLAADRVDLSGGQSFPHDLAVLSTGLRADPLVAELGLTEMGLTEMGVTKMGVTKMGVTDPGRTDSGARATAQHQVSSTSAPDGIPVAATLRYLGAEDVYAAGDCAHFTPSPLPKIGVHGVRQGPVLLDSLIRRAAGASLPAYDPPAHPLQILDLGGRVGLAARGQRWWCGRAAHLAKRWIDRRWLAAYR